MNNATTPAIDFSRIQKDIAEQDKRLLQMHTFLRDRGNVLQAAIPAIVKLLAEHKLTAPEFTNAYSSGSDGVEYTPDASMLLECNAVLTASVNNNSQLYRTGLRDHWKTAIADVYGIYIDHNRIMIGDNIVELKLRVYP